MWSAKRISSAHSVVILK